MWYQNIIMILIDWPPENGNPEIPIVNNIGDEAARWSQFAAISPVQIAPNRWLPGKNDRESTKGRWFGLVLLIKPWDVAAC